ncbi:MAG: nitrous oxide reductase accessory protein NosL [Acidobacteriota bacterium]
MSHQKRTLEVYKKLFAIISLLALSSCQKASFEPVAIAAEDMCSFCRMAISEKQYAAEIILADGGAIKFDDLACLVNYVEGKSLDIRAWYAMDHQSRQWIKAREAHFVRSEELKTPMGGQMIAFRDRTQAEAAASQYRGKLLTFDDLFRKE